METTDTRSKSVGPGNYTFTVASIPESGNWGEGKNYYDFKFIVHLSGGVRSEYAEKFPVWMVGPLLRALGCKEIEPEVFQWEKSSVVGIMFDAEIVEENYVKKDGTMGKARKLKAPKMIEGLPKDSEIDLSEIVPF